MLARNAFVSVVLLCTSHIALGITNELGWTLDSALKQIDRQASDFSSALTEVEVSWQATDSAAPDRTASGRLYVNEQGILRFEISSPAQRSLLVTKNDVHNYNPTRAQVERFALSKHKARLEPYIRLGFTTTGRDLEDDYLVTLLGEDTLDQRRIIGVELTPKKERARETVARLQLWIDQSSWMPVKQVIANVATGETLTVTYSRTARNLKLNPDLFKARWPKGTEKIRR